MIALAAGRVVERSPGPLLVTLLLLKVSGVTLLEQDIGERRPAYADYIAARRRSCRAGRAPARAERRRCGRCAVLLVALALLPGDASAREWMFDVTLDGLSIGTHRFTLRERRRAPRT